MNPLTGKLNRIEFLIWTIIYVVVFFALSIGFLEAAEHSLMTIARILVYVFIIGLPVLAMVIAKPRLDDSGLPRLLLLLLLFPVTAILLWVGLLFVPSFQKTGTNKSLSERLSDMWWGRT